ncbi:hypothetical protein CXG81DRAFT_17027 [Caulochytrium protostelioides]|uniref:Uncharacterized protein n=1 Tax=Caulochytrium protostelioides TaxID=1555241 RepID=A0A4P9XD79_9FUNG|nr:hypothetical protein CXG81DRAFT_17027 [Caulochytrium protostelioides]|eukprot:RKP03403.1 hypothetical protein CXG81DRAFT_17027 [Caulochytrium protostelioides]
MIADAVAPSGSESPRAETPLSGVRQDAPPAKAMPVQDSDDVQDGESLLSNSPTLTASSLLASPASSTSTLQVAPDERASVPLLPDAGLEAPARPARRVRFHGAVTVAYTWHPAHYDRSSRAVAPLTQDDITELIAYRQAMLDAAIALYRARARVEAQDRPYPGFAQMVGPPDANGHVHHDGDADTISEGSTLDHAASDLESAAAASPQSATSRCETGADAAPDGAAAANGYEDAIDQHGDGAIDPTRSGEARAYAQAASASASSAAAAAAAMAAARCQPQGWGMYAAPWAPMPANAYHAASWGPWMSPPSLYAAPPPPVAAPYDLRPDFHHHHHHHPHAYPSSYDHGLAHGYPQYGHTGAMLPLPMAMGPDGRPLPAHGADVSSMDAAPYDPYYYPLCGADPAAGKARLHAEVDELTGSLASMQA